MADTVAPYPMLVAGEPPHPCSPIALAAQIVSAFVGNNPVRAEDIGGLVATTHAAIVNAANPGAAAVEPAAPVEKPSPAQIKKSLTAEGIVSFIDGKTYKTLKRHLTKHGLDPHSYRQRYGLPSDYPMVDPGYAAARSNLAKSIGLGRPGSMTEQQKAQQPQAQAGGPKQRKAAAA